MHRSVLRFDLTGHIKIPRENELDFLIDAYSLAEGQEPCSPGILRVILFDRTHSGFTVRRGYLVNFGCFRSAFLAGFSQFKKCSGILLVILCTGIERHLLHLYARRS